MDRIRKLPISMKIVLMIGMVWVIFSGIMIALFLGLSGRVSRRLIMNQEDKINYFSTAVSKEIQNTVRKMAELSVDESITQFVREQDGIFQYGDYQIYREAYKELSNCFASSMYIDDVFLYLPKRGQILSVDRSLYSVEGSEQQRQLERGMETGENCFYNGDQITYLYYEDERMAVGMDISLPQVRSTLQSYESERDYQFFFVSASDYEYLGNGSGEEAVEKELYRTVDWSQKLENEYRVGKNTYFVRCLGNPDNQFYIVMYSDRKEVLADVYYMWRIWGILLGLLFAVLLFLMFAIRRMIKRPVRKLEYAMKKIEEDCYTISLNLDESQEFSYVFRQFNKMAEKIRTLIQEVLEEQILMEQIKNRQMSLQINPHFLFNSLYMGYRLAKADDTESVAELCLYLGDYFGVLTYASKDYIRLENEIQFTQAYLKLNKMRYDERLEYQLQFDETLKDERILPLLLQPLLGFLFSQGVEKSVRPVCRIGITIEKRGNWIWFSVWENSGAFDREQVENMRRVMDSEALPDEYFELWNLKHRIEGMYRIEDGVSLSLKDECLHVEYAMEIRGRLEQYV